MKSKIIPILLSCAVASLARADFEPVQLTPGSYTHRIVVQADAIQALPYCLNVTAGNGVGLGDNTYYEQGLYARPGEVGGNSGIPVHNTVFTNINNPNMSFLMPPDYSVNNELMVDSTFPSGTLLFDTATSVTNLAILCCGGGGSVAIGYTVTHGDGSTETGTLTLPDWFNGGSTVAWGANGRCDVNGNYNNYNSSSVNNLAPYLYANQITVSGATPVASITLNFTSGQHGNFFAVSGNGAGGSWTPIPLDPSTYNVMGIAPALVPFPLTATMDQGTNLNNNGNLATFFEQGFVRGVTGGLPASGSTFTSFTQPTHTYQMGDYSTNDAILIDTNHQLVNIVPAAPTAYSTFAFLTAGGNVGGTPMTNICILQHADGVQETNVFLGYDWFDNNHNGSIALKANGRVNMYDRTVNQVGNNYPYLFETYFTLNDASSPVTNIVVKYKSAGSTSSTTFIMAISAAAGGVAPVVTTGPLPASQTFFPGTNATFTVGVQGTAPITGYWQVENNGSYYTLADGVDANGSTISGSQTYTLTISNLTVADGTNYQFVANNNFGSDTSPAGQLIVTPQSLAITPTNTVYYTGNTIALAAALNGGPAVAYQWYYIDTYGNSNNIAGATDADYTITAIPLSANGYTYGVIESNFYGVTSSVITLSVSDSAAFLASDLSPLNAEAYAGAPVTYVFNAGGNSPISYQWLLNGNVVSGVTGNTYTLSTPCGLSTIQVAFSNVLSGGVATMTSIASLEGDASPTNITFNTTGINWQTNGSIAIITNNVLELTDGGGGESSSAFYKIAQYVGGNWTASYIYNSHGGSADGTAFILQNFTNAYALGGGGGTLGYGGINSDSLAFEINLYPGNGETPGIDLATDGGSGVYGAAGSVNTASTNDIDVTVSYASGVITATLTDTGTLATYTTNYTVGSISTILGGTIAYVGFSGADGGATSYQTVRNFQFHSVLPGVTLSVSAVTGTSATISWPADPTYTLEMTSSLSSPAWVAGPTPVTTSGVSQVTVSVTGSTQEFYRLVRSNVCE